MKAAPFVVVIFAAAISVAAQPTPGKEIAVQIIVGNLKEHMDACSAGKVQATTILVTGQQVRHCVKGELLNHGDEKTQPELFATTWVRASAGETIRWYSETRFRLSSVEREGESTPPGVVIEYPFEEKLTTTLSTEARFRVRNVTPDVQQRYKLKFMIGKEGNEVDPDVVCSM